MSFFLHHNTEDPVDSFKNTVVSARVFFLHVSNNICGSVAKNPF